MYTNMGPSSLLQETIDAVNAKSEVKRMCFGALNTGKNIRDLKFNFGPWRDPGALTEDEAIDIESEWEVERLCKEVKARYELYDWVAQNEVDAIASGWKE